MDTKKKRYEAHIFGNQYSLKSEATEEHIARVAFKLDSLMREISEKMAITDVKKIAILAALQLTESLIKSEDSLLKNKNLCTVFINNVEKKLSTIM